MTALFQRLRVGELLAVPSGLLLAISMFLPWYRFASGRLDAWSSFTVVDLLIAPAALAAPVLTWVTLTRGSPALPVAVGVWTTALGVLACACIGVRLLVPPPGAAATCAGAWLGLAGAVLVTAAAWISISDERPRRGVSTRLPAR